jgi:hypothetical protein
MIGAEIKANRQLQLNDVISQSIVICYREQVDQLVQTLLTETLNPVVARAQYTSEELKYASNFRCFMGHRDAWIRATEEKGYTLICEADFVPCIGLGRLPVFWPHERSLAWGYLYQGSPRLLSLSKTGHLRGHATPLVSYVINSAVARIFLRFFKSQTAQYGPKNYFAHDAHLQWWTMGQGAEAYIPERHYGEHGGYPQPEHARFGMRRGGLHRADNLFGPLAFIPMYADGSYVEFARQRIIARAYGWARLLSGRWIVDSNVYSRTRWDTIRMYGVGCARLLPHV